MLTRRETELDPTTPITDLSVIDALIAASPPSDGKSLTRTEGIGHEAQLQAYKSVEEILPVIKEMLEYEAANNGKKVYPKRLLQQQHIIAFMIAQPFATSREVCSFFGIGPSVLKNIMKSDTFRAAVNQHNIQLQNMMPDINEQLKDTLEAAISVVQEDVVLRRDPDFALQVLDKTANRLGMGTKQQTNVQINNNIVTPDMIQAARKAHQLRLEDKRD